LFHGCFAVRERSHDDLPLLGRPSGLWWARITAGFGAHDRGFVDFGLAYRRSRGVGCLPFGWPRNARGAMKRDLIAEGRLLRNVVGALRQALREHPEGCLEAPLRRGVEACGVDRGVFDEAIEILINNRWITRVGDRLHSVQPRLDG
jgi:hypothetical protein